MRNFKLTYPAAPTLSIDLYRAIKGAKGDKPSGGGNPGEVNASGALLAANRLSEYALDPAAQTDAQANLGLGIADPLSYYILAKA